MNFEAAYQFVSNLLKKELPEYLTYHNLEHTQGVITAVEQIAEGEKIDQESIILLKTAAAFHDVGYIETYNDNEPIGSRIAQENLPQFGYNESQIKKVSELILATKFPQNPVTFLDKIVCDADLSYVGDEDFFTKSEGLKDEFLHIGIIKSEFEWLKIQLAFLENFKFHTPTSEKLGKAQYQINLAKARDIYDEYENTFPTTE